jgi:glucose/mannose transport system substrate-binding protein
MPRMTVLRRDLLGGAAALAVVADGARAQDKPRITFVSQWSSGGDAAAVAGLGKRFETEGGIWQHTPVPGFTTEMLSKIKADIGAGTLPAASQLKGPEIAAWARLAPTLDLDPLMPAGYDRLMSGQLLAVHRPEGRWLALPMQVHRTTNLFVSRLAMARVGAGKPPATWAEFNQLATAMKAAGISPLGNGGLRWDDGMKLEIALAGISADAYRAALMQLDPGALRGEEMIRAFAQLRRFVDWMDPAAAAMHYSINLPRFLKGEIGMLLMGGWAQGTMRLMGGKLADVLITSAPQDDGKPCFVMNADSMIFWKHSEPDLVAGQKLLARLMLQKDVQEKFSQTTGSIPVRTDIELAGPDWTDGQRLAMATRIEAIRTDRVLLSFAHNMALPNHVASPMIDVVSAFVRDGRVSPEQGAARLAEAAARAQK